VQGLKPRNLLGFAFGSYGWSGESVKQVEKYLIDMGVEITTPPVKSKYVPAAQVLTECFNKGQELALKLKQKIRL
jgi:flavorubredoxin